MIIWLFIKTCFTEAIPFILRNWRIVIIGLMVLAIFYYKSAYERTVAELATYRAEVATLADKQRAINAEKLQIAKNIAKSNEKAYQLEISKRDLNSAKLKKELENEKSNIINLLNDAYRLRVNSASRGGVSKVPTSPQISTDGSSNATITIVRAGQSCAIDYKELMKSWLDNCKVYECE
jgi:hypothetical protein